MTNQEMNQNTDFLTKQHQYAREKEKADKILERYDFLFKIVLGFGFGIFFPSLMMVMFLGASAPMTFLLILSGGGTITIAIMIKKRKAAYQAKLDAQIISTMN